MNTAKIPLIVLAISFNSNKALKSYLQKINLKSGYAYIIIQEQENTTGALINELSEISDHIPIRTIKEGMSLERGKVYINSEKTIYTISSNRFSSKKNFWDSNLTEMISYFINSLADENKEGLAIIFFTDQGQVGQALETVTEPVKQLFFENQNYRLLSIAEQTKNSIITTDIEGKITYVNNSFLKLTGYDADFVLGKKPGHFLQGEETDSATVKIMSDALANGKGFEVDIVNYTKAGEKYWTNINCEPLLDANNKINGFFSFQYVISQQKENEEKIESLNEILQSRNKKLTELNKSLEEFAYVASHDLKEPARNIKGLLELILKKSNGQLNHNTEKYINMAIKSGDKMYQLINSLLEFSRSGILNESLQTITVKDVMEEVKFSLGPLIEENNVEIIVKDRIKQFQAYPILFTRLLQNLVQNSIKYRASERPKIIIMARESRFSYLFSVEDNGIGISEKNFQRIFKVFQKVDDKDSQSHGIGLAVCKKIVETHFGEIDIESQVGQGTIFHFSISKQLL